MYLHAMLVNILGADLNPNGSVESIYKAPTHTMPRRGLSSQWVEIILYALLMTTFASMAPTPAASLALAASSTVV